MEFFIGRVRANLHVVLCFSPVGAIFRVRARKFPALINCTTIDWFSAWPLEALLSVSEMFLETVQVGRSTEEEALKTMRTQVAKGAHELDGRVPTQPDLYPEYKAEWQGWSHFLGRG